MGGGLGDAPAGLLYQALNQLPNVHTVILTGHNEKLYQRLWDKYENIEVVPFTDRVPEYMAKGGLNAVKTGGITSFEAIAARLPMLRLGALLGREQENAQFHGGAGDGPHCCQEEAPA